MTSTPRCLDPDSFLRPKAMVCGTCEADGVCIPTFGDAPSHGHFCCPNCSPVWLKHFLLFKLADERAERGLSPLQEVSS